jgi:5-methylcytosine-specific restriction protein A
VCAPGVDQRSEQTDVRPSAAKRGYDWKWRNEDETGAADHWLAEHPLCAECHWYGHVVAATLVDHKLPHKGNRELFWDQENWQSLCGRCHNKKTQREQRSMNKYVVCGTPGSGKTTWVRQRAQRGDLVFDADYLVSTLFTTPLHEAVDFGFPMVERLRETVIDWLLNYPDRKAFIIQSDRDAAQRTAERIGAELIDCGAERWAKGQATYAH